MEYYEIFDELFEIGLKTDNPEIENIISYLNVLNHEILFIQERLEKLEEKQRRTTIYKIKSFIRRLFN